MSRVLCLIAVFVLSVSGNEAQNTEVGVFLGGSNYFGDLNPDYSFKGVDIAGGGVYRVIFNEHLLTKTSLFYGEVGFKDKYSNNVWQQSRNLRFYSHILELSQQIEFNFFSVNIRRMETRFTPYLLAGVSVFHFTPMTEYKGETYELRDIGTEGQNTPAETTPSPYSYAQLSFPIGGGVRFRLTPHWNINVEIAMRKTVTDYLDDVGGRYPDEFLIRRYNKDNPETTIALSDRSTTTREQRMGRFDGKQRGVSARKDDYLFMGVMLTYTFWDILCPTPKKL